MSHGCWTCRDRKVGCDLRLPTCGTCYRARRQCLGYGFRLAWPRHGDKRRMMVYAPASNLNEDATTNGLPTDFDFVNVSSDDLRLSYDAFSPLMRRREAIRPLPVTKIVSWEVLDKQASSLLDYYIKSGPHLFGALQGDILAPLVLRIAIADRSPASKAVLHAILALCCLHLSRIEEASAYRASSVSLLSASLQAGSEAKVAFQNIATSLILCMFEIHHASDTSVNWGVYVCGVQQIITNGLRPRQLHDQEYAVLRDWIYFWEVLARFSLLHWVRKPGSLPICYEGPKSRYIQVIANGSMMDDYCDVGYSRTIFDSISDMTDILLSSKASGLTRYQHEMRVSEVERRLRSFKQHEATQDSEYSTKGRTKVETTVQLYLLAALIYLNRTAREYSGDEPQHKALVEKGLSHLTQVQIWETPWPYFIIGCEAQTDFQRRRALQLIPTLQGQSLSDNSLAIQRMIESFWNQVDLDTERRLNYVETMSVVISALPFLPVFA